MSWRSIVEEWLPDVLKKTKKCSLVFLGKKASMHFVESANVDFFSIKHWDWSNKKGKLFFILSQKLKVKWTFLKNAVAMYFLGRIPHFESHPVTWHQALSRLINSHLAYPFTYTIFCPGKSKKSMIFYHLEHGNHVKSQRPFWIIQQVTVSNVDEIKKKILLIMFVHLIFFKAPSSSS